ncbi:MAG: tagaturonate epimerase family protein [Ignavibacteriaceae bacterium]
MKTDEKSNVIESNGLKVLNENVSIYPDSFNELNDCTFFIGKKGTEKFLYAAAKNDNDLLNKFDGKRIDAKINGFNIIKECELSNKNARQIQENFDFTKPKVIGLRYSFGFGDRIGLANPGHLKSIQNKKIGVILAQQSIREMTRTERNPDDIMSAAVWAVFQEGFTEGFGADADHLKTIEDINRLIDAGFTMFTFDPSDHVVPGVEKMADDEIEEKIKNLPWDKYGESHDELLGRYENKNIKINDSFSITPSKREITSAVLKYFGVVVQGQKMYNHLSSFDNYDFEVEISIDETDTVTSPFDHFFVVNEMKKKNVKFVSLAPRFIGDFEKGIDYKGDLNVFRKDFVKHAAIAEYFGDYKISLHSGSDKFSVYDIISEDKNVVIHVKTAGTSYLEAVKVTAAREPELFRKILDFSTGLYEQEKKTYHVSADINKVKSSKDYKDEELVGLFDDNNVRQILHVTFGKVLTDRDNNNNYIFRDDLYRCLKENEDLYDDYLYKHFRRHLAPFEKNV